MKSKAISGRQWLAGWLTALSLLLSGCAVTTTFTAYPDRINPLIDETRQSRPFNSQCFRDECLGPDKILYNLERGRLAQIHGQTEFSRADFRAALEAIVDKDERATVSASQIGGQTAAVLVNDNAIPYMADGYERVMLHHFQAMNFLTARDPEGAGVEIRRANAEQTLALRRHEKELDQAEAKARREKIDRKNSDSAFAAYAALDEVAGKVKNSFQNAYTFYVSGVVYELLGQDNDAYIDYKKALEIFPTNTYVQQDVIRLARSLRMDDDLEALRKRFPAVADGAGQEAVGSGELLVFFEDGFVPQKEGIKIPVPLIWNGQVNGYSAVAFPIYRIKWREPAPLTLATGAGPLGATEPICYLDALAVKALKEKVPAMVIRQVLRTSAKAVMADQAKKKLGLAGELGASLYNLASENPDLRGWATLPANAQILRSRLPAGKHRLSLVQAPTGAAREVEIEIKAGARTILRVIRAGSQLYATNTVY